MCEPMASNLSILCCQAGQMRILDTDTDCSKAKAYKIPCMATHALRFR